jgi:Spherulation-specific family 4
MHSNQGPVMSGVHGSSAKRPFLAQVKNPLMLIVLVIILLAAAGISARLETETPARCPGLFVPAFFYPGPEWASMENSRPGPGTLILDITSTGAGSSPSGVFQNAVRQARGSGIRILGYSSTQYGHRSAASVEADVRNYKAWYGVTGTFLDEVSTSSSALPYYRELVSHINRVNPGSAVWLNPGTYPDERYMSLGTVVMTFEGPYTSYVSGPVPRWAAHYPAARFANVIYKVPRSELAHTRSLAAARHVGHVYVTDRSGSNPYGSLPSYWSSEASARGTGCAG